MVRVAAYQAPLLPCGSMESLERIRHQVARCEMEGVEILCCPEAILGGLADYAARPADVAFDVDAGHLDDVLTPLASDTVTTILGFTERSSADSLYNSAAVFHKGAVVGVYRKLHPGIRRSIYHAGDRMPVFPIGSLTFGILICNDSNDPEPARIMARQGATALFVPTNNGLPLDRADVSADARRVDIDLARRHGVPVIRADVAGRTADLVSYGSSSIVVADGTVIRSAERLTEDLLVADLDPAGQWGARAAEEKQ